MDGDKAVLKGLERLFTEAGFPVSTFTDPARARDQIANRFVPIVVCDLDTPEPGAGIELVKFVRDKSPLSSVIVLTGRKAFDAVASAFRAGATDVVPKIQDAIPYLRERVTTASGAIKVAVTREQLLIEVADAHDDFLKKLMDLSRQLADCEDKLLARDSAGSSSFDNLGPINVLLVDDEPALNAVLERDLTADKGWRFRFAQSGGEALDAATQAIPNVVIVKEQLPDLTGSMVLKTIKASAPDAVALLFTPPAEGVTGEVKMMETSRLTTIISAFAEPSQLVASLQEVREALKHKARERRYLQVFRKQHFEFLKRHTKLRERLAQHVKGVSRGEAGELRYGVSRGSESDSGSGSGSGGGQSKA